MPTLVQPQTVPAAVAAVPPVAPQQFQAPPSQPAAVAPAHVAAATQDQSKPSTMRMVLIGVGVCLFLYVCYKYFYATDEDANANSPSQDDTVIIEKLRASAERNKEKNNDVAAMKMRSAASSKMPPVQEPPRHPASKPVVNIQANDPKFEKV